VSVSINQYQNYMSAMNKKYFILQSVCIPVAGAKNKVICDLQRNRIYKIGNSIFELFENKNYVNLESEVYSSPDNKELINALIALEEMELGIFSDTYDVFPKLNDVFKYPGEISNAIIINGKQIENKYSMIVSELNLLGVGGLELRFYDRVEPKLLFSILDVFDRSTIRSISLILQPIASNYLTLLINKYQRISSIHIHNWNNEYVLESFIPENTNLQISKQNSQISDNSCCGTVNLAYFNSNIKFYTQSLKFNNCLNKKVTIMGNGDIKNCPSTHDVFGNVLRNDLICLLF